MHSTAPCTKPSNPPTAPCIQPQTTNNTLPSPLLSRPFISKCPYTHSNKEEERTHKQPSALPLFLQSTAVSASLGLGWSSWSYSAKRCSSSGFFYTWCSSSAKCRRFTKHSISPANTEQAWAQETAAFISLTFALHVRHAGFRRWTHHASLQGCWNYNDRLEPALGRSQFEARISQLKGRWAGHLHKSSDARVRRPSLALDVMLSWCSFE